MTFKKNKATILFFVFCRILFLTGFQGVTAANKPPPDTFDVKTVYIHYRVNQTTIDKDYMNNAYALYLTDQIFTENQIEDIDHITITGKASPEGDFNNNNRLAQHRALALKAYIMTKYPKMDANRIMAYSAGEDWEGLLRMVENDPGVPNRDELLKILRSDSDRETQKLDMKNLAGGESYDYLLKYILPTLRGGVTGMIYLKKDRKPVQAVQTVVVSDTVEIFRTDTVYIEKLIYVPQEIPEPVLSEKEKNPFYIVLKNNLLYDIALLPNLSVEIPFGPNYNWSAGIEGNWSWWNTNADSYYYHRIQTAGVELRRWFANKTENPLNGWFVGAYGYGGTYDIRLFTNDKSDKGYLSNRSYSAGLTFGYVMPIAKRFNLEFGLGVGYFGGKYYKYNIGDCEECLFPLASTHQRNYFGPTKANISLVWLIGSGVNKKERKGDSE